MSKTIKRLLSFLLVLQLIIPYSTFAAAVGEFTSVVGSVKQTRAKETLSPVVKSPVELKDIIATAKTSSATMVFSDDSQITLSENTELEIKEFLFKDNSRRGIFSLAIGKVTAGVQKYIGGYNVFEVHSPTAGVGVRGTGFEFVEAMKDGQADSAAAKQRMATVSCTQGSLNLSAYSETGAVVSTAVLEAGQMAVIIGGVITISAIVAATTAGIAQSTQTGTAGAAGGGTAATTGMSTAAIAGIALGGAAVVGGIAAAAGGGGGDDGGSGGDTTITQQTLVATWGITASSTWGATSSGTIILRSGGSYTYDLNTTQPGQATTHEAGSGTWSLSGTSLTLTFDQGAVYYGTAQGTSQSFSMSCSNGWTLHFSRR